VLADLGAEIVPMVVRRTAATSMMAAARWTRLLQLTVPGVRANVGLALTETVTVS